MRCADKDFGAERPLVTTGEKLEYSQLEDFPGSSEEKRDRVSIAPLALPY